MVKVDTVYEDEFKRILRCSEGNRICVFMVPLNTRSSKVVVLNGGHGYVKFNIQK